MIPPWSILLYETWEPDAFLLKGNNMYADVGGMTYDNESQRLFMIDRGLGGFIQENAAVVHVWKVVNKLQIACNQLVKQYLKPRGPDYYPCIIFTLPTRPLSKRTFIPCGWKADFVNKLLTTPFVSVPLL